MSRKPSKPAKPAAKKAAPAKAKKPAAKSTKPAAKKAAKPEKPLPAKKAAAPAPKSKPAKAAAPRGAPPAKGGKAAAPKPKDAKAAAAAKKKPNVAPTGVAKPGLGHKWSCFKCGAKFYDLGKPVPVCPKCEADQRDRPPAQAEAPPSTPQPKRPAMAPMSRFLDDDEVAAPEPDEFGTPAPDTEVEETEAGELDIESLEEPAGLGGDTEFNEPEEE